MRIIVRHHLRHKVRELHLLQRRDAVGAVQHHEAACPIVERHDDGWVAQNSLSAQLCHQRERPLAVMVFVQDQVINWKDAESGDDINHKECPRTYHELENP